LSSAGHITESILQELKVFGSSSFVHVKRSLNGVAHILAREALLNSLNACWFSNFLTCIRVIWLGRSLSLDPCWDHDVFGYLCNEDLSLLGFKKKKKKKEKKKKKTKKQ